MRTTLSLLALLLLSLPVSAQESPKAGAVLSSALKIVDGKERFVLTRFDLASGERETLETELELPLVVDLSPSRKLALVACPDTDRLWLYEVSPWKRVEGFEVKGRVFGAFAAEDRVIALTSALDPNTEETRTELVSLKTDGSERKLVASFKEGYWDDIPLRVSPKGSYATFYSREAPQGLRCIELATGKSIELPLKTVFVSFSPDESTVNVSSRDAADVGSIEDGAFVKGEGYAGCLIDQLDAETRVWLKRVEGRSCELVVARGMMRFELSKKAEFEDGILRLVDLRGDRLVWLERPERKVFRIRTATLARGSLEDEKEVASEMFLTAPFLVP